MDTKACKGGSIITIVQTRKLNVQGACLAKVTHLVALQLHGRAELKAQTEPKCTSFLSVHTTMTTATLMASLTSEEYLAL